MRPKASALGLIASQNKKGFSPKVCLLFRATAPSRTPKMNHPTPSPTDPLSLAAATPGSVFLQTTRPDAENHRSLLFLHPLRILTTNNPADLSQLFAGIETALAEGLYVAGYLAYEAGYVLQNIPHTATNSPLAWFGVYTAPLSFAPETLTATHPPACLPGDIALSLTPAQHRDKVLQIKEHIAAGATYQVNLTDRIHFATASSAAELFSTLSQQQPVAYSAFLHLQQDHHILSFSPELFFRVDNTGNAGEDTRRILTRPMKGTWPRGLDAAEDALNALNLQNDEKNRSEHLMIVDLLRNDLGRLCTTGSIRVDNLFSIERYETLLQMTSTISGNLPRHLPWIDVFRSLFPSGSITGAPKHSTMQIIRSLEDTPRGIYTGAIGFIAPSGDATFNVAIRTLDLTINRATMGVGGGIVIDSDPAAEYAEAQLKAAFLTRSRPAFDLLETLLWDGSYFLLHLHLERLQLSCAYFDISFDEAALRASLQQHSSTFTPLTKHRVRLTLSPGGTITITSAPLPIATPALCRVTLATTRTSSTDIFLRHKTTHRTLYDTAFATAQAAGFDDVLFLNERDELTEGAISNLFLRLDGRLYTPPVTCGVLPGIYRRHLLDTLPAAQERILTLDDLHNAEDLLLCNSVRGLRRITGPNVPAKNSALRQL
jgi:para-aminobenzoate synthetase/4-amino-4-deoxychorismate lyase